MAEDNLSWDEMEESENEQVSNNSNEWEILERLEGLEEMVSELRQEKTEEDNDLIARIDSLEDTVKYLESGKERFEKEEPTKISREGVLDAWSKCPTSSLAEREPNASAHKGDIRADIQVIMAKKRTDPETADRWKEVFLERYGLELNFDHCNIDALMSSSEFNTEQMIRVFNIRAHVLYGWGEARMQILKLCDDRIGEWVVRRSSLSTAEYRELCRLYYT